MSPYAFLSSSVGTTEAAALSVRLAAWHDAMVTHERRLRTGQTTDACDDECPHAEARTLWTEALATLGPRASELTFLRSRAIDDSPSPQDVVASDGGSRASRRRSAPRREPAAISTRRTQVAQGEL
jgi:hypothetical protein